MKTSVYSSKVDFWLATVLVLAPLSAIASGIWMIIVGEQRGWFAVWTGLIMGVVMAALSIPCRYTIDDERISIRCGMYEGQILLIDIKGYFPTNNPWSAPTLSMRRIQIETLHETYLISPKDRDAFLIELGQRLETHKKT